MRTGVYMRLRSVGRSVEHRLGGFVAAKHHKQIADECSAAGVVEFGDIVVFNAVDSHLHHAHGAFNNLLAG